MTSVQLKTTFDLNPGNEQNIAGTVFLDLAQIYSLVNRISLRQGYQYAVSNIEFQCKSGGTVVGSIYKLPESWPCINAYVKAQKLWMKQQQEVLDVEPSLKAKYRDFKVFMNEAHMTATSSNMVNNLLPANYVVSGTSSVYDWEASEISFPAEVSDTPGAAGTPASQKYIFMLGDDGHSAGSGNGVGVIHGYAMSRARPQTVDPNTPQPGDWMTDMFDVGEDHELIRQDVKNQNDEAPYLNALQNTGYEYYPGGAGQGGASSSSALQDKGEIFDMIGITAGTGTYPGYFSDATGPGTFPLGLLAICYEATDVNVANHENAFPIQSGLMMTITMMPGEYKGFAALAMKDVN